MEFKYKVTQLLYTRNSFKTRGTRREITGAIHMELTKCYTHVK